MHGIPHEQWKRELVLQRLELQQELHEELEFQLELQQERYDIEAALRRKRDERPMTAGKVSFWGPKEEPVCCERCVSAARSLPGWLFGGCNTVDGKPGAYDDTTPPPTPPPVMQHGSGARYTTPRPCVCPSGDTPTSSTSSSTSSTSSTSSPPVRYMLLYHCPLCDKPRPCSCR